MQMPLGKYRLREHGPLAAFSKAWKLVRIQNHRLLLNENGGHY